MAPAARATIIFMRPSTPCKPLTRNMPRISGFAVARQAAVDRLFANGGAAAGGSFDRGRALIVDDDQICNVANEIALERANYDCLSASDGISALGLLNNKANLYDLILLDIEMPRMNGLEVYQRLRNLPHRKLTPVIFVTVHGDYETRIKSLPSRGSDLISKPISPLELIVKAKVLLFGTDRVQRSGPSPGWGPVGSERGCVTSSLV